jgi:hypothetical protein
MRFVLLSYTAPDAWGRLSDEERAAWEADDTAFTEELARRGCVVHGSGLDGVDTTTTVRVTGGETTVTDGPYAETAEVLGGFLVIDVHDLDEALAFARRSPAARLGPLEVRPVLRGTG